MGPSLGPMLFKIGEAYLYACPITPHLLSMLHHFLNLPTSMLALAGLHSSEPVEQKDKRRTKKKAKQKKNKQEEEQ